MMAAFGNTEIKNNFEKSSFSKLKRQSQSGVDSRENVK